MLLDQIKNAFGFRKPLTAEEEIGRFIEGLASMTDADLGVILAVATVIRVNMEDQNHLPTGIYENSKLPPAQILAGKMVDLAKVARHFDRLGQTTDAVAAVAVLNTLRCLNAAELRHLGRDIWVQLGRGVAHVEKALKEGEANKGEPFPKRVWTEYAKVPAGLESAKRASKKSSKIRAGRKPRKKVATWPKSSPNS